MQRSVLLRGFDMELTLGLVLGILLWVLLR